SMGTRDTSQAPEPEPESVGESQADDAQAEVPVDGTIDTETPDSEPDKNEMITLQLNPGGQLYAKSQVTDYSLQGTALEDYDVHDFFTNTYEASMPKPPTADANDNRELSDSDNEPVHPARRGRSPNMRSLYHADHPHAMIKLRVVHTPLHWHIINYVGRFFPSKDDPTTYPFYCASMLPLDICGVFWLE
ncbi:hypothetical protein PHLCEN_2v9338, partial [Hermanssonia centrifuga]